MKWIYLIAALCLLGAVGTAKYLYDANQTLKTEKALLEAQNAKIVEQGNRYANKPRTRNDTDERLCAWAQSLEAGNSGKSKRGLLVRSCP